MCTCVCAYVCLCIGKGGFPTFEIASLLIKQQTIHLNRKKSIINQAAKTEGTLQEKSRYDWNFSSILFPTTSSLSLMLCLCFALASKQHCTFGMITSWEGLSNPT